MSHNVQGGPVVVGAVTQFELTLDLRDPDELDGKTVRAAIRVGAKALHPVDDSLEAIEVTIEVTEGGGRVARFELTQAQTARLVAAPEAVPRAAIYYAEFYEPGGGWVAEAPFPFPVRRPAANLATPPTPSP